MEKVAVMVSGGIDSLVAYRHACSLYGKDNVSPVFVNVGQPYYEPELALCKEFYGDRLIEFSADMCNPSFGNLPTITSQEIYGRNLMLALFGAIVAPRVWIAALETEMNATAVPDKRPEFFHSASALLTLIFHGKQKETIVETPFKEMTKSDVVSLGVKYGLRSDLIKSRSCYDPNHHSCGECSTCFKRWVSLVNNGLDTRQFKEKPYANDYALKIIPEIVKHYKEGTVSERYSEKRIRETVSALRLAGLGNKWGLYD